MIKLPGHLMLRLKPTQNRIQCAVVLSVIKFTTNAGKRLQSNGLIDATTVQLAECTVSEFPRVGAGGNWYVTKQTLSTWDSTRE
jgi:hypothetical protein